MTGPTALAFMSAGNIAVGFIEAAGCVICLRFRRRGRRLAMADEEESFMPPTLRERRRLNPSSAFMYTTTNASPSGDEDRTEFVGPYFTMVNPLHLVGNADAAHNKHLALVVDGGSRLHGELTVLNAAEGDEDVFHVSATEASVQGPLSVWCWEGAHIHLKPIPAH